MNVKVNLGLGSVLGNVKENLEWDAVGDMGQIRGQWSQSHSEIGPLLGLQL